MSTITPPRSGIPIGFLDQRTGDVRVHPEYLRYFESLFTRVGGFVGSSNSDLTVSQFEDAGIAENFQRLTHAEDEFGQLPSHQVDAQRLTCAEDEFRQLPTYAATPAGSTTQIQVNNAGSFAGYSSFTYTDSTKILALGGHENFVPVTAPTACTAALAGLGAGNIEPGDHKYFVTFVTASGETEFSAASNTVTTVSSAANGQNSLTGIPIGPTGTTARKLYRSKPASSGYYSYFLATIADNTTTTYTDNLSDASRSSVQYVSQFTNNTTAGQMYVNGVSTYYIGKTTTQIGLRANGQFSGDINTVAVGTDALANNKGINNVAIGVSALQYNSVGIYNTAVGQNALQNATDSNNCAFGMGSLITLSSGYFNSAHGYNAGAYLVDGSSSFNGTFCTFLGCVTKAKNANDTNATVIGNGAVGNGSNTVVIGNTSVTTQTLWGSVGINTLTPSASAALDVPSTTQGVLFPRMTTTQKNAISSPASGLVVYDTTLGKLCVRGASAWETITSV